MVYEKVKRSEKMGVQINSYLQVIYFLKTRSIIYNSIDITKIDNNFIILFIPLVGNKYQYLKLIIIYKTASTDKITTFDHF